MNNNETKNQKSTFFNNFLRLIVSIAILVVGIFIVYYMMINKPPARQHTVSEKSWFASTVPVKLGTYQPSIKLFGEIVSARQIDLRASVSGEIIDTSDKLVDGSEIKKGETLFTIDPFDYQIQYDGILAAIKKVEAQIKEIKAQKEVENIGIKFLEEQYNIALSDYNRAKGLIKDGVISQKGLDDKELSLSQRKQALELKVQNLLIFNAREEQLNAELDRQKVTLRKAKKDIENTNIKAPFDSYLTNINARQGMQVNKNERLSSLIDKNLMDATFILTDTQYGRLLESKADIVGRQITVTWKTGVKEFKFNAKIVTVAAEIDSSKGGITVFARIENNQNGAKIKPGIFVEIDMLDRQYNDVLSLPQASIYGSNKIFIVENNRLERRQIDIIGYDGENILVKGNFANGEQILISRIAEAAEGILVRTKESNSVAKSTDNEKTSKKSNNTKGNKNPDKGKK